MIVRFGFIRLYVQNLNSRINLLTACPSTGLVLFGKKNLNVTLIFVLFFKALPNLLDVDEKWQCVLHPLYSKLFTSPIFWTPLSAQRSAGFLSAQRSAGTEGSWVTVQEAIFDCMKETQETCQVVTEALLASQVSVVKV